MKAGPPVLMLAGDMTSQACGGCICFVQRKCQESVGIFSVSVPLW
jgi:hypothetical protein